MKLNSGSPFQTFIIFKPNMKSTAIKSLKAISVLYLLLASLIFKGQNYVPMLNSYSEWHVTNCFSGCATDKYYTIGDTIINNLHYQFLDLFHYNKNFVIREDTTTRKVYMRLLSEASTVKEYLLYDFFLQENDTMSMTNPGSPFPKFAGSFLVDSIRLKPIITGNRRFFYLHSLDTTSSLTRNTVWIEGIGSQCLINTPGAPADINGAGQLSCFFHNNIHHYQNLDSITDCTPIYPTYVRDVFDVENINIVQNFDEESAILIIRNTTSHNICIFDPLGRLLLTQLCNDQKNKIDLSRLPKGILLVVAEDSHRNRRTFKLINP